MKLLNVFSVFESEEKLSPLQLGLQLCQLGKCHRGDFEPEPVRDGSVKKESSLREERGKKTKSKATFVGYVLAAELSVFCSHKTGYKYTEVNLDAQVDGSSHSSCCI